MTRSTVVNASSGNEQLAAWLQAAGAGDKVAKDLLLRDQWPRWYAIARRILGNDADAGEAAQQAAVKLLTGLGHFDPERGGHAKAWLARVGANVALDMMRRRRGWQPLEEAVQAREGPAEEAARHEEAAQVRDAMAELPPREREALRLRFYEGLTLAQTARRLGLASVTAAHRLVRRAVAAVGERVA